MILMGASYDDWVLLFKRLLNDPLQLYYVSGVDSYESQNHPNTDYCSNLYDPGVF
jgi:hypothetical protein